MIIYCDLNTGCELFTDASPLKYEGNLVGVPVKFMTKDTGINEALIGGNASAEAEEQTIGEESCSHLSCEEYQVRKVNIESIGITKKILSKYWRKYFTQLLAKLKKDDELELVETIKKTGKDAIEAWAAMFNPAEVDLFAHDDIDLESADKPIFIGVWSDCGKEVDLWTIKDVLRQEKC